MISPNCRVCWHSLKFCSWGDNLTCLTPMLITTVQPVAKPQYFTFPTSPASCRLVGNPSPLGMGLVRWEATKDINGRCAVEMQGIPPRGRAVTRGKQEMQVAGTQISSLLSLPSTLRQSFCAQPTWRRPWSQAKPPAEPPAMSVPSPCRPSRGFPSLLAFLILPHTLCPAFASQIKHWHFHPCLKLCFLNSLGYNRSASGFYFVLPWSFVAIKCALISSTNSPSLFLSQKISMPIINHLIIQINFPKSWILRKRKAFLFFFQSSYFFSKSNTKIYQQLGSKHSAGLYGTPKELYSNQGIKASKQT